MRKINQLVGDIQQIERPQAVIDVTDTFNKYLDAKVDKLEFVFEQPSAQQIGDINKIITKVKTQYSDITDIFGQDLAFMIMGYKGSHVVEGTDDEFQESDASSWIMLAGFADRIGKNDPVAYADVLQKLKEAFPKLSSPIAEATELKNA